MLCKDWKGQSVTQTREVIARNYGQGSKSRRVLKVAKQHGWERLIDLTS